MAQSINTKVELTIKGTSFLGLTTYGTFLLGDKGFEFFNDRNVNDYVQIPWEEVDKVIASIMFKGKYIPRFAVRTKANGTFSFAAREPKKVLKVCEEHVGHNNVVASLTFFQTVKRGFAAYGTIIWNKFSKKK